MGDRRVYLLLTDTGTLFTRMIKLYTKECLNHASISFDSELTEVYSFGRKRPRNPFIGGFVKEDIRSELFRNASCALYVFTVKDNQYHRMVELIKEIDDNQQKYRYNLIGLFAIALNKQIHRKYAFFCSHFVAMILKEGRLLETNKHLCMITPQDLKEASSHRLIYQGDLHNYLSYREKYLEAQ
ncbi:hypothetical protein [Cytobacillus dafuensis]|uniref:Uncharacterized protein n=1 Tax=Cytobacillus dafuensis TaxID=1742359 RepID=A0A5B8Z503_CYTDA|nr:hypothetical protein [Cytobacillus dafuensis]QED48202.1 hypothetical protein FSZ17_13675 [Cytobacillus dafuensis]